MGKIDDDIQALAGDVAEKKSAVAMQNLALFMEAIRDGIEEFADADAKKIFYDKGLGKTISEAIEKAFVSLSKLPAPKVTINPPNINIDLSQMQSIASDISKNQKDLIVVLEKINSSGSNVELVKMVTAMIGKQNSFLEKGQQFDYNKKLQELIERLKPVSYEILDVKREKYEPFLFKGATIKPIL